MEQKNKTEKTSRIKRLGKKGFVDDLIYWVPKLIYYNIVFFVLLIMIFSFMAMRVELKEAEARAYLNRVIFSQDSIYYYDDELERSYPGIVDIKKFNDNTLNLSMDFRSAIESENTYLAMSLNITYQRPGMENAVAYHNGKWYDRFLPRVGKRGKGGARMWQEDYFVTVMDEQGNLEPGTMNVRLLMPND